MRPQRWLWAVIPASVSTVTPKEKKIKKNKYCLTHAITHHTPKTDPPCSEVSLRQLSYLLQLESSNVTVTDSQWYLMLWLCRELIVQTWDGVISDGKNADADSRQWQHASAGRVVTNDVICSAAADTDMLKTCVDSERHQLWWHVSWTHTDIIVIIIIIIAVSSIIHHQGTLSQYYYAPVTL